MAVQWVLDQVRLIRLTPVTSVDTANNSAGSLQLAQCPAENSVLLHKSAGLSHKASSREYTAVCKQMPTNPVLRHALVRAVTASGRALLRMHGGCGSPSRCMHAIYQMPHGALGHAGMHKGWSLQALMCHAAGRP